MRPGDPMKKQAKTSRGRGVPRSGEARARGPAHYVFKAHEMLEAAHLLTVFAADIGERHAMDGNGPVAKAWDRAVDACMDFYQEAGRFRFSLDEPAARAGKSRGDETNE